MSHLIVSMVLMPLMTFNAGSDVYWVDVYVRDAATKAPIRSGHFTVDVSYWVPNPVSPRFHAHVSGPIRNAGYIAIQAHPGESHRVVMSSEGYCESTFSFPAPKRGKTVIREWTVAEVKGDCPPDKKQFEYQIVRRPKKANDE